MWFEVVFFDNLTKVFKKEKAALRTLCGGRHIIQCRRNGWKLGTVSQCDQYLFVTDGGVSTVPALFMVSSNFLVMLICLNCFRCCQGTEQNLLKV